ncbi:aminotransferase class IV [Actinomadura sp. NAK00032]|uniref:aminotransferase class IV n=1 Tax=Actinomadura sp. NAK00032 TaxID=2742128 RepID=UPI0020C7A619|nr:aminotransferase class IV [Actinomadura sp. NAK00032]
MSTAASTQSAEARTRARFLCTAANMPSTSNGSSPRPDARRRETASARSPARCPQSGTAPGWPDPCAGRSPATAPVRDGFDDAAFIDRRGRFSEATIWNLAFWDGDSVLWPDAEMLTGTTMGIVRRQLTRLGVPQRTQEITPADLPTLAGAVVMNSWTPGIAVHQINSVPVPEAPRFLQLLHQAYEAEPLTTP